MKRYIKSILLLVTGSLILVISCVKYDPPELPFPKAPSAEYNSDLPNAWYKLAITLMRTTTNQAVGPICSRAFGYMGLTLYESVAPGFSVHKSIQPQLNGLPSLPLVDSKKQYYYSASANAALASMVHRMFGNTSSAQNATIDSLENEFNIIFKAAVSADVFNRSVIFGREISDAIYKWSKTDGGNEAYLNPSPAYTPPTGPGLYVPLTGQLAQLPYWGNNRTFIAGNASSTQPLPPPAYSTDPSSLFYKEELEVYNESINQDPEHRDIALYWAALSPPCVSLSILSSVLTIKKSDLFVAAEAYCKVGIATSDALVSCYKTKYTYNEERPITYIRRVFNPTWTSLIPTPPFPDYTSAHSVQTGACARVMADIFGDNTTFTDLSINDLGFKPRTFTKFSDYAYEVGLSRIYGGIHTRTSDFVGLDQGNVVGMKVSALHFDK